MALPPAAPPLPPSPAALQGVRVIEMGQLIAGPFCGKTLGEFGADVIKIEAPETGDPLRNWRLIKEGTSVWWQVQSRNKRSVALDLRQKEGQDIAASKDLGERGMTAVDKDEAHLFFREGEPADDVAHRRLRRQFHFSDVKPVLSQRRK